MKKIDSPGGRKLSGISAVFPTLDDGGTIGSMVLAARAALSDSAEEYEIIVVDNGSRDYTGRVLSGLERLIPELRVIRSPQPLGYGGAVRSGFAKASKEWIFYTDGDAQYNPLELVRLTEAAGDGVDVVNGYKTERRDPWYPSFWGGCTIMPCGCCSGSGCGMWIAISGCSAERSWSRSRWRAQRGPSDWKW
jgi:glycosyltransferase involved in cell wall biosynthesis